MPPSPSSGRAGLARGRGRWHRELLLPLAARGHDRGPRAPLRRPRRRRLPRLRPARGAFGLRPGRRAAVRAADDAGERAGAPARGPTLAQGHRDVRQPARPQHRADLCRACCQACRHATLRDDGGTNAMECGSARPCAAPSCAARRAPVSKLVNSDTRPCPTTRLAVDVPGLGAEQGAAVRDRHALDELGAQPAAEALHLRRRRQRASSLTPFSFVECHYRASKWHRNGMARPPSATPPRP
jgi:hypothetical protein